MAANLGAEVDLITRVSREYDRGVFEGLTVRELPAATACRYANRYDENGHRTQLLLHPGAALDLSLAECDGAQACVIAPAFHEFTGPVPSCDAPVRAVLLQGALRATDGDRVVFHPEPLGQALRLALPGAWVFLSVEDAVDADSLARSLARHGCRVFVTRAHIGATLFADESEHTFPAIPARSAADPTGAGDCFAAAFVVLLAETGDVSKAVRFALAAGSLAVESIEIAGIPGRDAIERRLEREAA
jgi:pfkB family carbohydrate kinase